MAESPRLLRRDGLQRWLLSSNGASVRKELEPSLALDGRRARAWLAIVERNRAVHAESCAEVMEVDAAQCSFTTRYHQGVALTQLGVLAAPVACALAITILTALEAAAAHELVHLDLDAAGILVRRDGSLLLPEFGLWGALSPAEIARVRFDAGRVAYMSPELVQASQVDTRSDLFVLGWLLYDLLAGRAPFSGETPLALAMAIDTGAREPLSKRAPGLDAGLCDVVETLLQTRADARFETPRAARRALESAASVDLVEARRVLARRVAMQLEGTGEPRTRQGLGLANLFRPAPAASIAAAAPPPVVERRAPLLENPFLGGPKREPRSELVAPPPLFLNATAPAKPPPSVARAPTSSVRAPRGKPAEGVPVHDGRTAFLKLETALRTVLPRSWQRTSAHERSAEGKWQEPSSTVFRVRPVAMTIAVVRSHAWPRSWRLAFALWFGGALLTASYLLCQLWF
ncbi:MAG: protein kinase [Polyangiales bacterium]